MKNNNIVTKSGNLMCDGMIVNGDQPDIRSMIYTIRGVQVMLDRDLAMLYGVATGALNQAVKRNSARFPERFMFQMSPEEFANWKSQSVISNSIGTEGIRQMKLRQWHYCERCASFDITNCYIKTKLPLAILFQWFFAAKNAKGAKELGPHARCRIVCPLSFVVRPLTLYEVTGLFQ